MHVVFGDSDQRRGLEAADGVPAQVAHRVRQAVQGFDKFRLPSNDLVHGDFRTANFRFARGRLLAVIDNDTAGPGCRCLDLATVLLEAHMRGSAKSARVIGQHGLARFGSRMLTVCLAWQVLEMAYFGLRRWPRSELDRYCSACIDLLEHAQEDGLASFFNSSSGLSRADQAARCARPGMAAVGLLAKPVVDAMEAGPQKPLSLALATRPLLARTLWKAAQSVLAALVG